MVIQTQSIKMYFDSWSKHRRTVHIRTKCVSEKARTWLSSFWLWLTACGTFPLLCICPDYTPLFSFYLPFSSFSGVSQEGVYRTVGSNIQVQKLLNAFFGKKTSQHVMHLSIHCVSSLELVCLSVQRTQVLQHFASFVKDGIVWLILKLAINWIDLKKQQQRA